MDNGRERKTKTPEQALAALMRLAARSEKSSGDALRLMRGWGVDPAAQQGVLQKLQVQGFIDDRRYASAYVREKSRLNGWGVYKIRRMLSSKGIAKEITDDALREIDGDAAAEKLTAMLRRKMGSVRAENNYELKGKLLRYGLSLGYEYDEVAQKIDGIINDKS